MRRVCLVIILGCFILRVRANQTQLSTPKLATIPIIITSPGNHKDEEKEKAAIVSCVILLGSIAGLGLLGIIVKHLCLENDNTRVVTSVAGREGKNGFKRPPEGMDGYEEVSFYSQRDTMSVQEGVFLPSTLV